MRTFKQYYITEANALLFDLINKGDMESVLWSYSNTYIRARIFDVHGNVNQDRIQLIDRFNTKISQLFTKEVIIAMNQYGVSEQPNPERAREGRDQIDIDRYLRPYLEDMVCTDMEYYNSYKVFMKLSVLLNNTTEVGNRSKYRLQLIDSVKKIFQNIGGIKDWMTGSGGELADNLYIYLTPKEMARNLERLTSELTEIHQMELIATLNRIIISKIAGAGIAQPIQHFYDFMNDRRLDSHAAQKTGIRYAHSMEGIIEYFMKSPTMQTIGNIARDYNRFIKLVDLGRLRHADMKGHMHEVFAWEDGTRMVQPMTQEFCKYMGKSMNHCVGGYDPLSIESPLLQLIDYENRLVATIELNTDLDYPIFNTSARTPVMVYDVQQIKGKMNQAVDSKYKRYMEEFFDTHKEPEEDKEIGKPLRIKTTDGDTDIYIIKPHNVLFESYGLDYRHFIGRQI